MNRPIGVTLLAVGAGLIGIYELYRTLIFMGVAQLQLRDRQHGGVQPAAVGPGVLVAGPRRDLVLGGQGLLGAPRVRLLVRRVHRAVHAHLGLHRPAVRLVGRGRDHPVVPGARDPALPAVPGRAAALRQDRAGSDDARAAGRVRPARGGERRGDGGQRRPRRPRPRRLPRPRLRPLRLLPLLRLRPRRPRTRPRRPADASTRTTRRAGPGNGAGSSAFPAARVDQDTRLTARGQTASRDRCNPAAIECRQRGTQAERPSRHGRIADRTMHAMPTPDGAGSAVKIEAMPEECDAMPTPRARSAAPSMTGWIPTVCAMRSVPCPIP